MRRATRLAAALVLLAVGAAMIVAAVHEPSGTPSATLASTPRAPVATTAHDAASPTPAVAAASPAPTTETPTSTPEAVSVPVGKPVEVSIPAIGVDAAVVELGLEADGELEVPGQPHELGWWSGGALPGGPGAAIIVGHVDWYDGPAVFRDLRDLAPGDEIEVRYADGDAYTFRVDRLADVAKAEFPSDEVYGPTEDPVLRLITCSGSFDRSSGVYDQNLIVFATLASPPASAALGTRASN